MAFIARNLGFLSSGGLCNPFAKTNKALKTPYNNNRTGTLLPPIAHSHLELHLDGSSFSRKEDAHGYLLSPKRVPGLPTAKEQRELCNFLDKAVVRPRKKDETPFLMRQDLIVVAAPVELPVIDMPSGFESLHLYEHLSLQELRAKCPSDKKIGARYEKILKRLKAEVEREYYLMDLEEFKKFASGFLYSLRRVYITEHWDLSQNERYLDLLEKSQVEWYGMNEAQKALNDCLMELVREEIDFIKDNISNIKSTELDVEIFKLSQEVNILKRNAKTVSEYETLIEKMMGCLQKYFSKRIGEFELANMTSSADSYALGSVLYDSQLSTGLSMSLKVEQRLVVQIENYLKNYVELEVTDTLEGLRERAEMVNWVYPHEVGHTIYDRFSEIKNNAEKRRALFLVENLYVSEFTDMLFKAYEEIGVDGLGVNLMIGKDNSQDDCNFEDTIKIGESLQAFYVSIGIIYRHWNKERELDMHKVANLFRFIALIEYMFEHKLSQERLQRARDIYARREEDYNARNFIAMMESDLLLKLHQLKEQLSQLIVLRSPIQFDGESRDNIIQFLKSGFNDGFKAPITSAYKKTH